MKSVKGGGNPFIKRVSSKTSHGNKSEKRISDDLEGEQVIASGAIEGLKGDIYKKTSQHDFMIESKSTVNQSITLKKSWLDKVKKESMCHGKTPCLSVSFVDENGKNRDSNSDWVAIPLWVFKELTNEN